ncbi:Protein arginine N-methyltransferase 5 [Podochytrium sp. JEL0797]|nr:Protein arginine N-methyltransferase 5 [Podochytrium sp. JEL0797]
MSTSALRLGLELIDAEASAPLTFTLATQHGFSFGSVPVLSRASKEAAWPFAADALSLDESFDASFFVLSCGKEVSLPLLKRDFHFAKHVGVSCLGVEVPTQPEALMPFAQQIAALLPDAAFTQLVVRVRATNKGWLQWNTVRCLSNGNPNLHLALELVDPSTEDAGSIERWMAEPVKLVVLESASFLKNKKQYPVLSKNMQKAVQSLMALNVQFILSIPTPPPITLSPTTSPSAYKDYLNHLHALLPPLSDFEQYAASYNDYLQAPLQPLMDNLESATYEVFEKCPAKYRLYEEAVRDAMCDRITDLGQREFVLCVFGAGRGPLVDCVLRARDSIIEASGGSGGANASSVRVKVIALEKNPNAIVGLKANCGLAGKWGKEDVEVVWADMRFWVPTVKADILVSELLGSFGDNELSPECLDGAQKVLKPNGISIPSSYTAFISPVSSTKLHAAVQAYRDVEHAETPYVVKLKAICHIGGGEPVPVWTFTHPRVAEEGEEAGRVAGVGSNDHNTRFSSTRFEVKEDILMHGIAGYFESTLYTTTLLSINPPTHSPDMSSWFPLYFPLKDPLHLVQGMSVDIMLWRCTDERKVWYEWAVCPVTREGVVVVGGGQGVHNGGGRSSWIGL